MTDETKRFPLRTILSVTTGRLLTKPRDEHDNGIGDLYELLGWMTDDSPMTHQLPRFNDECKPWLLRWFPELQAARDSLWVLDEKVATLGILRGIEFWLTNLQLNGLQAEYDVPRIPADDHERKHPFDELVAMRGTDEGIIIVKEPNQ